MILTDRPGRTDGKSIVGGTGKSGKSYMPVGQNAEIIDKCRNGQLIGINLPVGLVLRQVQGATGQCGIAGEWLNSDGLDVRG